MIPVAAVARPRQGIRMPATGALPLSAGGIIATAGNGQVTITQGTAPTGTITSRTLYRSTTAGQLGTAVVAFVGAYPFIDTGRANATSYYYTLRVSDGSATADTPQASATPVAAGGSSILLLSHDWESGGWGPITPPTTGNAADYAIVTAPPWFGTGKAAEINFHRDSLEDENLDKNRSFYITQAEDGTPIANFLGTGQSWGSELYVEFDVGFGTPTFSGHDWTAHQGKILYWQFGNPNNEAAAPRQDWVLTTWANAGGNGLYYEVISGGKVEVNDLSEREWVQVGHLPWDTKVRIGLGWKINSGPTTPDAELRFWANGVLLHERVAFYMAKDVTGLYHTTYAIGVGNQFQADTSSGSDSLFQHRRYFDNLAVYNRRPGT